MARKRKQPDQQLGSLIKSARDIMRKDKGLSGDLDRLPMLTCVGSRKSSDVLKVPPISEQGNVSEIIDCFGGVDQLQQAVAQLQATLYAA